MFPVSPGKAQALAERMEELGLREEDLEESFIRSGGKGGQNVNKVSTCVVLVHKPTRTTVKCQQERSQHQNRATAMTLLQSRLYQVEREKEASRLAAVEDTKKKIEWGSQIRSYVFHPYNMVKDHRTGEETSAVQGVMDGELADFVQAYLLKFANAVAAMPT